MLRFTTKFPRQYVVLPIAFFIFFALCFADPVESAQTRNSSKTKATPAKKNAKTASTPNKKSQAKATPTPKNSRDKDKKGKTNSSSNRQAKNDAKNKAADKSRQNSSKTNQKTSAKNTRDSKSKDSKSKDSKQNARNTKNDSRQQSAKNAKSNNSKSDNSRNRRDSDRTSSSRRNESRNTTSERTSERRSAPERNTTKSTTSERRTTPRIESQTSMELPQIIVTDVSARVRSQAQASAPEVSRIRLGTVLKVTEKNPAWYKVQYSVAGGKTANGWISANSVNDLNAGAREELYRQIVDRNYKAEMDFAAASEMVDFLTQVTSELGNSNAAAELELKRLLALQTALKKIPDGQGERSPYREFLKAHEKSVIYSDPAGEWYVVSNLFWDLHKKYAATTFADQIAWQGAENPLPGECEGYVNCYLFSERMTNGEYLRLHPNGKKAAEALANLTRFLSSVVEDLDKKAAFTGPTDVTDRAEFNNLLAELRTIVSRLPQPEKEKTLQQLKQIAEAYR